MPYKITMRKEPKELLDALSKIDKDRRGRLISAIKKLAENPTDPKPFKAKLSPYPDIKETENVYRILVGISRIHYQVQEEEKKVVILRLGLPKFVRDSLPGTETAPKSK